MSSCSGISSSSSQLAVPLGWVASQSSSKGSEEDVSRPEYLGSLVIQQLYHEMAYVIFAGVNNKPTSLD